MNISDNQRLDQLLNEWSNARTPDSKQASNLEEQVLHRLNHGEGASTEPPLSSGPIDLYRWRYPAAISALAATLFIAFGLGRHWEKQQRLEKDDRQLASGLSWEDRRSVQYFSPSSLLNARSSQLIGRQRILYEFQGVFDRQIAWIADVDGELKVALVPTGQDKSTANHRYLAICLTLLSNSPNQAGWEVEQSYEVLANTEELLQVPLSTDNDSKLTVWAYPVEDGLVSIETQCHLAGAYSQQVAASHLQSFGQHNQIHTFEQDGIEYRLYQTAVMLEPT